MFNKYIKGIVVFFLAATIAEGIVIYKDYQKITQTVLDERKVATAALIREKASTNIKIEDFTASDVAHSKSFQALFNALQSPDLVRMKVWDTNNTVIWSNLVELIGQRYPDNTEVKEAIAGEDVLDVSEAKAENVSERDYISPVEIYVPFKNAAGSVVGIVEVYHPYSSVSGVITQKISDLVWSKILVLSIWPLGFLLSIFWYLKGKMSMVSK